jgi:hypothetical protein
MIWVVDTLDRDRPMSLAQLLLTVIEGKGVYTVLGMAHNPTLGMQSMMISIHIMLPAESEAAKLFMAVPKPEEVSQENIESPQLRQSKNE